MLDAEAEDVTCTVTSVTGTIVPPTNIQVDAKPICNYKVMLAEYWSTVNIF